MESIKLLVLKNMDSDNNIMTLQKKLWKSNNFGCWPCNFRIGTFDHRSFITGIMYL